MNSLIMWGLCIGLASSGEANLTTAVLHLKAASRALKGANRHCSTTVGPPLHAATAQIELEIEAKAADGSVLGAMLAPGLREVNSDARAQRCPQPAIEEIDKAIATLMGSAASAPVETAASVPTAGPASEATAPQTAQQVPPRPDDEEDLRPETPAALPANPENAPQTPASELDRQLADAPKLLVPGFRNHIAPLAGNGSRGDWAIPLDVGYCYAFVGLASPRAARMALYLFGPQGRLRDEQRSRTTTAIIFQCPLFSGMFHLQAKVKKAAPYAVGVYIR